MSKPLSTAGQNAAQPVLPAMPWPRYRWQIKAVLPIAVVLLQGLLFFVLVSLSMRDPERNLVLMVATGGAFVICAAMMVVLGYQVGRPMMELQRKIAALREGDMTVSVEFAERNDEIGELGRDFNRMVLQLKASRAEIDRLHRTQISRAEHLAVLGELAAGLAHEIRNPLAGIAGVMEIVGKELPPQSRSRSVLHEVRHEVQHIDHIVSELLHVARPRTPNYHPADLNETVEHAHQFARQQAPARIRFTLDLAPQPPVVEHDLGQMRQVMLNLMLNALQAVDGEGSVHTSVRVEDEYAVVSVTDTGRGIPADQLQSIFRPFFTTRANGTGLGLSMVQRLVQDHGGTIEVTSQVGTGSEFRVKLPIGRSDASQEQHSPMEMEA